MSSGRQTFRFEGREIPAQDGMTVAAALTAAGELELRHTRQGDTRGLFCGMGVCQECLVTIDGEPGQRACMSPASPGISVSRQPSLPRLTVSPAGGASGSNAAVDSSERHRRCQLLVIGGGPGGLSAAAAAAEAGLDVVLVDERAKLGGQYFKQPAGPGGAPPDGQFAAGRALIERATAAGVEIHSGVTVWGAFGLDAIEGLAADGRWRFACDALVLAPGAYERGLAFPGWTLPGVMTTGAAQTLWRSYGTPVGHRILVCGNGPLNMQVAAELTAAGAQVVGMVELGRPASPRRLTALGRMAAADPGLIRDGLRYRRVLAAAKVPVIYGSVIVRAEGEGHVSGADVMKVDGSGRPVAGSERRFEVDAVCLGYGFVPSTDIARALGASHHHDAETGQTVTTVDPSGATSLEHVWVVGDGATIRGARYAQAHGQLVGIGVARKLPGALPVASRSAGERDAERAAAKHMRFQRALASVFAAPHIEEELAEPDTHLCRCEGVSRGDVERALDDNAGHVGAIKRVTRAGMGPCQGRYCGPLIAAMAARRTGIALDELSGFAPTPPIKPVEIGTLLGDRRPGDPQV